MPEIRRTGQFKKDYKRESKGRHRDILEQELRAALALLSSGDSLPVRYLDHALSGAWKDCRDCHLKPDLVLIYRRDGDGTLTLVRLGSHSELGL